MPPSALSLRISRRRVPAILAPALLSTLWLGASSVRAAGLMVPSEGGSPLAIEDHRVRVDVVDGIAVTEIDQTFRNDDPRPLEAVYSFPLPQGASLAGFSMWIDGREMAGEVLERQRARQIYQQTVHPAVESENRWVERQSRLLDPGLAEQVSYRQFRITIFPVPARGTQRVKLTYVQHLLAERDRITWVYPLETRGGEDSRARGRFALDASVSSSVPIAEYGFPGSPEDAFTVAQADAHRLRASMTRADGDLDRDFVMSWRLGGQVPSLDLVTHRRRGEDGTFLLLATAPLVARPQPGPVDFTFVIDVSGSMRRMRKLEMAGEAIIRFLESGSDSDRFNAIVFNVSPEAFAPAPSRNEARSREALRGFLRRFQGVGGTDLYPALERAYALAGPSPRQAIVIVSDGGLNDLDEDHDRFLRLVARHDARVFGLSVGHDANAPLLQALAEATGGFAAAVSSREDLLRRGEALYERMRSEPWRDLSLNVAGRAAISEVVPEKIPDLYPGAQVCVLGRYRGSGPAVFRLTGTRAGVPETIELRAELPEENLLAPQIRRTWAERSVHEILQGMRAGRLPEAERERVVRLGEGHSIVTPFTSFLVLESDAMYERHGIGRRSHALLEEESGALQERARRIDAAASAKVPGAGPARSDWSEGLGGGALDPLDALLAVAMVAAAGVVAARRL